MTFDRKMKFTYKFTYMEAFLVVNIQKQNKFINKNYFYVEINLVVDFFALDFC